MSVVSYELQGNIGIITISNPPVNVLSHGVRAGIKEAIENAQTDKSKAIILICEGRTFIAGADITEFGKTPQKPLLPEVMTALESSSKPVIAALHGTALGGGFETAMACHYRCALPSAKVGLPEVKLGLLPGAGGTQRTPRLAGIKNALDLITSGLPISANKALDMGLIDAVLETDDLKKAAYEYAQTLIENESELKITRKITIDKNEIEDGFFDDYRKSITKKSKNQIAQNLIIDCVEAAVKSPFDEGLKIERANFTKCRSSGQSAALRHIFFAERESKKIIGLSKETPIRQIEKIAIIGGGLMGCGIAINFANAGIPVKILEISEEGVKRSIATVRKIYNGSVKKGKMTESIAEQNASLITGTVDYTDFGDVDLVIEAAFESLDVKKQVFTKLDEVCKEGTILATNTSYLDINDIASITNRPSDVIGLHFFSPAHIMKLLEIVRADKTSDDVVATAMALAGKIKKIPALSRVCYGFIGNRMLRQYLREVQICLLEGATPEQIDTVMVNWGMAMGPLTVADMAGLDISYKARQVLTDTQKGDPKSFRIADVLVEKGRLGQKSGSGYYKYDPETRARTIDPEVTEIINQVAADMGLVRKQISDTEILKRLTLSLINEGFKILEENIAQRSSDIDVVYCFGYGFPAYRGGPMFLAETMGLNNVYEDICNYRETHGDLYWTPSALLKSLVESNKSLDDHTKSNA